MVECANPAGKEPPLQHSTGAVALPVCTTTTMDSEMDARTLYVGGLRSSTREADVLALFEQERSSIEYARVISSKVLIEGNRTCICFVVFHSVEEAVAALQRVPTPCPPPHIVAGSHLVVQLKGKTGRRVFFYPPPSALSAVAEGSGVPLHSSQLQLQLQLQQHQQQHQQQQQQQFQHHQGGPSMPGSGGGRSGTVSSLAYYSSNSSMGALPHNLMGCVNTFLSTQPAPLPLHATYSSSSKPPSGAAALRSQQQNLHPQQQQSSFGEPPRSSTSSPGPGCGLWGGGASDTASRQAEEQSSSWQSPEWCSPELLAVYPSTASLHQQKQNQQQQQQQRIHHHLMLQEQYQEQYPPQAASLDTHDFGPPSSSSSSSNVGQSEQQQHSWPSVDTQLMTAQKQLQMVRFSSSGEGRDGGCGGEQLHSSPSSEHASPRHQPQQQQQQQQRSQISPHPWQVQNMVTGGDGSVRSPPPTNDSCESGGSGVYLPMRHTPPSTTGDGGNSNNTRMVHSSSFNGYSSALSPVQPRQHSHSLNMPRPVHPGYQEQDPRHSSMSRSSTTSSPSSQDHQVQFSNPLFGSQVGGIYQQDPFSSSLSTHSLHQIQQEPSNGLLWTSPPDSRGMSPCSTPSLANGSPNSTRQSTPSSMMDPNYGHHHYPQLGYHSSPRSQLQHQQHQQHQQYSPHMLQLPGGSSNSPQQLYGWSSGAMDMDSAQMHRRIQDQTSQYQMHQCQEMESEMGCGGPGSRGARSLSGGNLSSMEAMWRQQQLYHQQGYAVESPGSPNSHSPDSHWGSPCPTGNHVAPSHSPLLHNVTRTHRVLSSPPACGSPLASTHRKLESCDRQNKTLLERPVPFHGAPGDGEDELSLEDLLIFDEKQECLQSYSEP